MGVKDLWQLLAPIGRRVSIESLEGKILAIDVSIWINQFIKAMRDEDGKMIKNAHILGTMRRILKLLFHRIRPIFVFDGATPALKLNTIRARKRTGERQEQSKRVAAQKLLLAQLKQHAIKTAMDNENDSKINKPDTPSKFTESFVVPKSSSSSSAAGVSLEEVISRFFPTQFLQQVGHNLS